MLFATVTLSKMGTQTVGASGIQPSGIQPFQHVKVSKLCRPRGINDIVQTYKLSSAVIKPLCSIACAHGGVEALRVATVCT